MVHNHHLCIDRGELAGERQRKGWQRTHRSKRKEQSDIGLKHELEEERGSEGVQGAQWSGVSLMVFLGGLFYRLERADSEMAEGSFDS
jgi:hypothetical protein